jgi:hypothetical protein
LPEAVVVFAQLHAQGGKQVEDIFRRVVAKQAQGVVPIGSRTISIPGLLSIPRE